MRVEPEDERCDLIAKWIYELKGACDKGDIEVTDNGR
jgi:hypothetical protein